MTAHSASGSRINFVRVGRGRLALTHRPGKGSMEEFRRGRLLGATPLPGKTEDREHYGSFPSKNPPVTG